MKTPNINVDFVVSQLGGDVCAAQYFEISRQAVAKWRKTKTLPRMVRRHLKDVKPELLEAAMCTDIVKA